MSIPNRILTLVFLFLLILPVVGDCQPSGSEEAKGAKTKLPTDRYGDPLPEGAIGRLGTMRFRHGFYAGAIAFSPDGKYLASGGRYPGLRLWDAASGKLLNRPALYGVDGVNSLAFSPDSKMVLVSSGTPTLIDVASGKVLGRFPSTSDFVAFSPNGQIVAAEERDKVTLFKVVSRQQIRQIHGHTGQINCLAFSPKGESLATGSQDKTIRFWEVASGTELRRIEAKDEVSAIAYSPNGKLLAWVGEEDPTIRLVDLVGKKADKLLKGPAGWVYSIAFSRDGKLLASGGHGGKIFLWDVNTGKQLRHWQAFGFRVGHLAFSPDGKILASTGVSGSSAIRLWDTASGKEIHPLVGHTGVIQSLKYSGDGNKLFSLGQDQRAITWNVAKGLQEDTASQIGPFGKRLVTATLSPDGKLLAGRSFHPKEKSDDIIRLWDTRTGKELHALDKHKEPLNKLAFSDDGKVLASSGRDGIHLWDPASGKKLRQIKVPQLFGSLAFSPNGKILAAEGADKKVRLWDLPTGNELRRWDSQHEYGTKLVFSPDSKLLASFDILTSVWEVVTGRVLMHVPQQYGQFQDNGHVQAMAFSPSGRFLASIEVRYRALPSGEDHYRIILRELASGQVARQIDRQEETVWSLAFHPNGRILASGRGDSTILLWDMTGRLKNGQLRTANLTDKDLDALWAKLGGDASQAYPASWTLAADPSKTIPFFEKRMQPVAAADEKRIRKLIADLESDSFAVRSKAFQELAQLGELGAPGLRDAKPSRATVEFNRRVNLLLARLKDPVTDPVRLRMLRAIEVLENIGSPQARKVLERLATGTSAARLTREAQASLQRLKER